MDGQIGVYRNAGGSWVFDVLDSGLVDEQPPSLAFDSTGTLHVVWYREASGGAKEVRHASWDGSSWSAATTIAPATDVGNPTIAVDGSDRLHVFYRAADDSIGYATRAAGASSWSTDTAWTRPDGWSVGWPSAAVTGTGKPIVAFETVFQTRVSWLDGSTWRNKVVDGEGALQPALTVDSQDRPHLVDRERESGILGFQNYLDGRIQYATPMDPGDWGGDWTLERLPRLFEDHASTPSIALDANDRPVVGFRMSHIIPGTAPVPILDHNDIHVARPVT